MMKDLKSPPKVPQCLTVALLSASCWWCLRREWSYVVMLDSGFGRRAVADGRVEASGIVELADPLVDGVGGCTSCIPDALADFRFEGREERFGRRVVET